MGVSLSKIWMILEIYLIWNFFFFVLVCLGVNIDIF